MQDLFIRVKGVIKQNDQYLVLKQWQDDRIVDPYVWGFVDCEVERAESPDHAVLRAVHEATGVEAEIVRPLYTWSQMIGDIQCVGIAYLCRLTKEDAVVLSDHYCEYEWITESELPGYIDNKNVLKDILRAIGES
jgi:ADP-ribose pyrophosphatase YjhB (NUDIX family)